MDVCKNFYGEERAFFDAKTAGHTAYEIAHQPLMWRALAAYLREQKPAIDGFLQKLGNLGDVRIVTTGAGSSGFVGRAVSGFAAQINGVGSEAIHTTDICASPDVSFPSRWADKPTLLVSFARSGNSPESVGAVEVARKKCNHLYELAIVCDGTSKLAVAARTAANGLTLVMPEGTNDNGFAMTSSVSSMILAGCVVLCGGDVTAQTAHIEALADIVEKNGAAMVAAAKEIAAWDSQRAWYLGCGALTALVQEGALKMMELTNGAVVAGHNNAPEFRHGPKTVMNPKTVTIHFISQNPFTAQYDRDLLNELYSQRDGNKVVALYEAGSDVTADLKVPYTAVGLGAWAEVTAGMQGLVFMQLISLFTSLHLGITTDNPSPGGLVNRVVQGVTVYPC